MGNLSIKERVLLWFSLIMMLVMILISTVFIFSMERTVSLDAKNDLENFVEEALDDIHISKGELTISDNINYSLGNVRMALFNEDKEALSGVLPESFGSRVDFVDGTVRQIRSGGKDFFVYDRLIENRTTGNIWVRGIVSAEIKDNAPGIAFLVNVASIVLPIIYLLAVLGGWLLVSRAFRPLELIADTASEISSGDDLSKRIGKGAPDSYDEVLRTAGSFDKMMDRVEESFENEKQFTNNASHELRTPTAVIMAQSEYALKDPGNTEEVTQALEAINYQAKKMSGIVSQLLMLARADRGTQKLKKEKTDISLLAEEAAQEMRRDAEEKNIDIRVDATEGLYLDADPTFFSIIYRNIISNAIKYGKENGKVDVSCKKEDDSIVIEIKDDGEGISKEDQKHIFERFFRSGTVKEEDGTGLGLPLVKWAVEEHGGTIGVTSEKGKGSVFRLVFKSIDQIKS